VALAFMALLVAVLLAGWLALEIGARGWIPELLVILVLGVLAGPVGVGFLHVSAATPWVRDALVLGAALLLFEGTQDIPPRALAPLAVSVGLLATVGVAVTALVSALAARLFAALPWPAALVFGAAVAATDPAATTALLRAGRLAPRIRTALLGEAAFNDAVSLALVTSALAFLAGGGGAHGFRYGRFGLVFLRDGLLGALAGLAVAWGARFVRRRAGDVARRHAPILVLLAVAAAYVLGTVARGSGFVAVFVLGIALRPEASPGRSARTDGGPFGEAANALVRIVVFFLLGASLDARALLALSPLAVLAVPLALVLIARPLAVAVSILPDRRARWSRGEALVLAASRPTGVVPAVLAAFLAASALPGAREAAALIAASIVVTLALAALLVPPLARRAGLVEAWERPRLP
jgi:cell volume regulation protein A